MAERTCTVEGCEKMARRERGRGFCSMHDERWRRYGSTDLPHRPGPLDRFFAKVDASDGIDACHPWTGYKNPKGYGRFNPGGGAVLATRWLLGHLRGEPLGPDEEACHRCDNPPCVNERHLYVGCRQSNMADATERKRMPGRRSLNSDQVREIRALYERGGVSQRELARRFGVQQPAISRILAGVRWT